ncbi:Uncharacterised protein [Bacteroides xylanisolvens]|nr:Uncharacterised protein [Bacteroides xylanisolvens]
MIEKLYFIEKDIVVPFIRHALVNPREEYVGISVAPHIPSVELHGEDMIHRRSLLHQVTGKEIEEKIRLPTSANPGHHFDHAIVHALHQRIHVFLSFELHRSTPLH